MSPLRPDPKAQLIEQWRQTRRGAMKAALVFSALAVWSYVEGHPLPGLAVTAAVAVSLFVALVHDLLIRESEDL